MLRKRIREGLGPQPRRVKPLDSTSRKLPLVNTGSGCTGDNECLLYLGLRLGRNKHASKFTLGLAEVCGNSGAISSEMARHHLANNLTSRVIIQKRKTFMNQRSDLLGTSAFTRLVGLAK